MLKCHLICWTIFYRREIIAKEAIGQIPGDREVSEAQAQGIGFILKSRDRTIHVKGGSLPIIRYWLIVKSGGSVTWYLHVVILWNPNNKAKSDQVTMVLMDLQMMRLSHSIMVSFKKLRREWIQLWKHAKRYTVLDDSSESYMYPHAIKHLINWPFRFLIWLIHRHISSTFYPIFTTIFD